MASRRGAPRRTAAAPAMPAQQRRPLACRAATCKPKESFISSTSRSLSLLRKLTSCSCGQSQQQHTSSVTPRDQGLGLCVPVQAVGQHLGGWRSGLPASGERHGESSDMPARGVRTWRPEGLAGASAACRSRDKSASDYRKRKVPCKQAVTACFAFPRADWYIRLVTTTASV